MQTRKLINTTAAEALITLLGPQPENAVRATFRIAAGDPIQIDHQDDEALLVPDGVIALVPDEKPEPVSPAPAPAPIGDPMTPPAPVEEPPAAAAPVDPGPPNAAPAPEVAQPDPSPAPADSAPSSLPEPPPSSTPAAADASTASAPASGPAAVADSATTPVTDPASSLATPPATAAVITPAQKPSVGRIVVYTDPDKSNGHPDQPAIITGVWTDDFVNLKVFFDCGPTVDKTSQSRSAGQWDWPRRV